MPESGRLVAGGGHLHGGGIRVELLNATCGTTLFSSRPTWGGPVPRPILHEPGPTKMSAVLQPGRGSRSRPATRCASQRSTTTTRPYTRAMGIMMRLPRAGPRRPLRAGAAAGDRCGIARPLRRRSRCRSRARRRGKLRQAPLDLGRRLPLRRTSECRSDAARRSRGASSAASRHDVTLVNGPVGFSSPWTLRGTFRHRFTRAGHLPAVLLAAPGEDGAADQRPVGLVLVSRDLVRAARTTFPLRS